MKSTSQDFARQLFLTGKGCKAIATILRLPQGTVKTWRMRGQWRRSEPPSTQENEPPPLLWCSSLHYDSAHLVNLGTLLPACGAKIGRFDRWTIQPDPLRKCTRCMPHDKSG